MLRVLLVIAIELFTGAREETITHIQLRDVEIIWMQSGETGNWIPGVLIDYANVKFAKDPWHRRQVLSSPFKDLTSKAFTYLS